MTPRAYVLPFVALVACSGVFVVARDSGADLRATALLRTDAFRVQRHLRLVEGELRARAVSSLTPRQRAARARNIEVLHSYLEANVFPHNHDRVGKRVPYFRDTHGTLCAVAYLMEQSGRRDLVDRIAYTDNNVYVRELAGDVEVAEWLRDNGLSLEEAARIQPSYGGIIEEERTTTGYAIATAVMAAADGGVVTWNFLNRNPRALAPGVSAVATGFLTVLLGVGGSIDDQSVAPVNSVIGAATGLIGALKIITALNARAEGRAPAGSTQERRDETWSPFVKADFAGRTVLGFVRRF